MGNGPSSGDGPSIESAEVDAHATIKIKFKDGKNGKHQKPLEFNVSMHKEITIEEVMAVLQDNPEFMDAVIENYGQNYGAIQQLVSGLGIETEDGVTPLGELMDTKLEKVAEFCGSKLQPQLVIGKAKREKKSTASSRY